MVASDIPTSQAPTTPNNDSTPVETQPTGMMVMVIIVVIKMIIMLMMMVLMMMMLTMMMLMMVDDDDDVDNDDVDNDDGGGDNLNQFAVGTGVAFGLALLVILVAVIVTFYVKLAIVISTFAYVARLFDLRYRRRRDYYEINCHENVVGKYFPIQIYS